MKTLSYWLKDLKDRTIPIGFVGENLYRRVIINCKEVFDDDPDLVPAISITPPKGDSYPGIVTRDGDLVYWDIQDSDLANKGNGEIQLSFVEFQNGVQVDNGIVGKSYTGRFRVERSIEPTGEAPESLDDFITEASAIVAAIPQTIDNALEEAKESGEFDGVSPTVEITAITGGHRITITDADGTHTADVMDGEDGESGDDGYSPTVSITSITGGHRIMITDKNGDHTADIMDGQDGDPGTPGADGVSPTVAITNITGGHTVTITDKNGSHAFNVMDGVSAIDDNAGEGDTDKVWSADKTAKEVSTLSGAINVLQPAATSGDIGKFLKAKTVADGKVTEYEFGSASGSGVSDVQVNGTSVVTNGVANIPFGQDNVLGLVKARDWSHRSNGFGVYINTSGDIAIVAATDAQVKGAATSSAAVITPANIDKATFYGLAKIAGANMNNSSNTAGVYTEDAKSAISQMLDAPETVSGTTPSIAAKAGVRYICGEVATLTIVVPSSGIIDVTFDSGSTPTVLTVTPPTGMTMKWANGFDPTSLEANTTYEINIADGCLGVAGSW